MGNSGRKRSSSSCMCVILMPPDEANTKVKKLKGERSFGELRDLTSCVFRLSSVHLVPAQEVTLLYWTRVISRAGFRVPPASGCAYNRIALSIFPRCLRSPNGGHFKATRESGEV